LTDLKIRGDAASAVLDHSSATPGNSEFAEADITRLAYNRSQRIELKREAMQAWTDAVFEAVEKEWSANRPLRIPVSPPLNLKAAKKLPFYVTRPWYAILEDHAAREAAEAERNRENVVRMPMASTFREFAKTRSAEPDDDFW
jgi:hypothetical protein